MVKKSEFSQLVRDVICQLDTPIGAEWWVAGFDVEMLGPDSWFSIGLRGDSSPGGLLLRPHYGVMFHHDLWTLHSWCAEHPIVGALDDHNPEEWPGELAKALRFLTVHSEELIREYVMDFCTSRGWDETRAYVHLELGDTAVGRRLLRDFLDRQLSTSPTGENSAADRCAEVWSSLEAEELSGAMKVLRNYRAGIQSQPAWKRFERVKGTCEE